MSLPPSAKGVVICELVEIRHGSRLARPTSKSMVARRLQMTMQKNYTEKVKVFLASPFSGMSCGRENVTSIS